ncbi:ribosome biogenesis factor YjgA [uncultured Desulfovibrio sp.]|uniref:ribosome biogenesis factor YjgA n=1 Tax=uncultured Desulfovibrio sp. TaxID=167968 RepID=UPI00260420BF|nr:ribosome biogenesis factor YjgA [uncultured Desulfovibrio sp.]
MPRKRAAAPGPENDRPQTPSRSASKRDSHARQALGMEIARLTAAERAALPLTPELAEAMDLLDRLTDHEGRRRQEQYIGRLMREADGEALRRAMARRQTANAAAVARFHAAESWRPRLLEAADADVPRLLEEFWRRTGETADADAELPRAVEAARAARARGDTSPRASRVLFRRLADALAAPGEADQ